MPIVDYLIQPGEMATPEAIDRKRKMAQMLALKGSDTSPVGHWSQGAARIVDALSGGLDELRADALEKNSSKFAQSALDGIAGALGGGGSAAASPAAGGAPVASGGDYFATMAQKESGGNPNARNPSGATGLYQFMPGTWRGLMEKNPNLGLTYEGITDPQQQQVAMRQFTQDNAAVLSKAGVPVNNATLALAHQQGAGGAIKLLSNPDAPAASIVGAKAVTANGGNLNMTAGQFAQHVTGYYGYGNTNPSQIASAGQYATPQSTPQQAPAGQYANADMPEAGAQPVQYQPPGGQSAPQQGGMTRVQAIMQLSKAWPYMNEAQRQQAQMYINAMPQAKDPVEAALQQEQLTKTRNENAMAPLQRQQLEGQVALQPGQLQGQGLENQGKQLANQKTERDLKGAHALVTPQERKAVGIPDGDQTVYVLKPDGTIEAVGKPSTTMNTTIQGESEFDKGMGRNQSEMFSTAFKDGQDAKTDLSNIKILRSQMAQTPGGMLGGLQGLANSYGLKLGPNASAVEVASSLLDKLTPAQRQGMPGAASDRDVAMFKNALPKLSNTPEGNAIILDTMQALAEYRVAQGEIAQKVSTGKMSRQDGIDAIAALPSPFDSLRDRLSNVGGSTATPPSGGKDFRSLWN